MNNKFFMALLGAFFIYFSCMRVSAAGIDQVIVPEGYINVTDKIHVETTEGENKELISIRVKLDHGAYRDITETKCFNVSGNCTAHVKIKYRYFDSKEEVTEIDKDITNFDGTPPRVNAYIKGEELLIKITDDISGPESINIDGKDYTDLTDGSIGINLKELENSTEFFVINATDQAGNRSNILRINNPYYVGEDPKSNSDEGVDNPQSIDKSKPTQASGTIISHTDEDGEDLSNVTYREWKSYKESEGEGGSKQFFTIRTKSDKTFYIVVDESNNQQTAYLLTEASENDLLNFVNYDGNTVDLGETNVYSLSQKTDKTSEGTEDQVQEPVTEAKTKKNSAVPVILILVCAGGVAYYFKFVKKDTEGDEEDELDDEKDKENTAE